MRNKYLLICDSCGYLSTDYVSEESKYICPLCSEKLREIYGLTSDNYNNFIYKNGVGPEVDTRQDAVRRNLMKDFKQYNWKRYAELEDRYYKECFSDQRVQPTVNITNPETKKRYEDGIKAQEVYYENYMKNLEEERKKKKPTRHCPVCNSTNVKPISTVSRAVHGAAFGLFSKTARSQFECKNCGYKF